MREAHPARRGGRPHPRVRPRPSRRGRADLARELHRLCWSHHQLKTAGLLDPTRVPDPTREPDDAPGPVTTDWEIDGGVRARTVEHTDLVTPVTAEALEAAWRIHQRLHADAERLAAAERARPRRERVDEQRRKAMAIAHLHLRSRLRPPDPDAIAALGDPPF